MTLAVDRAVKPQHKQTKQAYICCPFDWRPFTFSDASRMLVQKSGLGTWIKLCEILISPSVSDVP